MTDEHHQLDSAEGMPGTSAEPGRVRKDDLQELVKEWRERNWSPWSHPRDGAYVAADELEELIE